MNEFYTDAEILGMFSGFRIERAVREHYRAEPIARRGWKASLYRYGFAPVYNLLPEAVAKRFAYKSSISAVKV